MYDSKGQRVGTVGEAASAPQNASVEVFLQDVYEVSRTCVTGEERVTVKVSER